MKALSTTLGLLLLASGAVAAQPRPAPMRPLDYSNQANWLCLPGRADACRVDLSAMIVPPNGRPRLEEFRPPTREPPIDCFYVYPTVSRDPGLHGDLAPGPEERRVIADQFARFSSVCRTYAPLYRQVTLTALRQAMAAPAQPGSNSSAALMAAMEPAYEDVRDAFFQYIRGGANAGRGFVLIGHSQGALHLTRLLREEIEGTPLEARLVSAILLGTNIEVPAGGATLGGTFRYTPLCQRDNQTGCVITYSSFRDTQPPGPDALFARASPSMVPACTNPANLRTGRGTPDSYLSALGDYGGASGPPPSWTGDPWTPVGTPFVKVPGLIQTACVGGHLSVRVAADPRDARTDTINGDVLRDGRPDPAWGLHLIDVNLSLGNLVDLVAAQGRAWRPPRP